MTERKRRQNLAKCYSVSLQKAEWIIEGAPKRTKWHMSSKKICELIIGSEMWYVFGFSWHVAVIFQSGLNLYDFTTLAAGVETEQVCNPVCTTGPSCACLIDLKTEFELEQVIAQLRNKITVARNVIIH